MLTNGQYGFHRDELAAIDEATRLAWGYVPYPPLLPFFVRLGMELFGTSLVGVRFFSPLAQAFAVLLSGLMARELGGGRLAQVLTALAVAIATSSMAMGSMIMYVSFDYLWWILAAYAVIRLLRSEDPRWWLLIGAAIGLGMMTKYTMGFFALGIAGATLLTPAKQWLKSGWLWAGAGLAILIFLPNLIWQVQHEFVSLEFLGVIHARDVQIGRTIDFLPSQFYVPANPLTVPWWAAGLGYLLFRKEGQRWRMLGWMFVIPFVLFFILEGRNYYTSPLYPMLLAAGYVVFERWLRDVPVTRQRLYVGGGWAALAIGAVVAGVLTLPVAPVNSPVFNLVTGVHDNFVEQIGWPELVEQVAQIYASIPEAERATTGIVAGNYGEAAAINFYGDEYGLPGAISGVNSYWLQGYGDPPPETLIVIGFQQVWAEKFFTNCRKAGKITNTYGVLNEETEDHPDVFVCGPPYLPWPELWLEFRWFG